MYGRGKGVYVAITTKALNTYRKHIVSEKIVEYNEEFFIAGSTKYYVKPILYLQIRHVCAAHQLRRLETISVRIPYNFIHKFGKRVFFWRIGILELSRLQIPRKQSYLI
uniref:GIY-YIG domain-containing protein n=1 Tax=Strongyloides venezuelensis TaxID=75913 RepID=A0A0K0FWS3_STRVS